LGPFPTTQLFSFAQAAFAPPPRGLCTPLCPHRSLLATFWQFHLLVAPDGLLFSYGIFPRQLSGGPSGLLMTYLDARGTVLSSDLGDFPSRHEFCFLDLPSMIFNWSRRASFLPKSCHCFAGLFSATRKVNWRLWTSFFLVS